MTSIHCIAIVLVLTGAGLAEGQFSPAAPVTRQQIAQAIGTDADTGAVLRLVLALAMPQSRREFLLASQIPLFLQSARVSRGWENVNASGREMSAGYGILRDAAQ